MSGWGQQGNYNPNAQSWTPGQGGYGGQQQQGGWGGQQGGYGGQQGGYGRGGYQQQGGYQQGGYGGGYNQGGYQQGGYGGGYNQQQGGYQQGGYQQGGYQQQQGGYQQGGYGGGYNNQQQQQEQQAPAPAQPAPVEKPAETSAADKNKLKLDLGGGGKKKGGKKADVPSANDFFLQMKQKKAEEAKAKEAEAKTEEKKEASPTTAGAAKTLSLGGASKAEETPAPAEEPKKEEAPAPEQQKEEPSSPAEEKKEKEVVEAPKKEVKNQKKMRVQKEYKRDPRPHYNVVFCGHVDAGKSTISGHLLVDLNVVDDREMQKYRREAEAQHREGWEYAYTMDVSEEERAKGKTHETGAAYFETEKKRVTILDAPGHKAFVPSMIGGAAQADICVLVISGRTGEFETGFENGGQTREHAMLVRACGVKHMICVINKMDDQDWDEERYKDIRGKLEPFLKQNGYAEKAKNLTFMPVSGLNGTNLVTRQDKCSWYKGPCLLEYINELNLEEKRSEDDDLVFPVAGAYKDEGKIFVYGKVESGSICVNDRVTLLPIKNELIVDGINIEGNPIEKAYPGDNVHLIVRGVDESQVHAGYVVVMEPSPLRPVDYFQARIIVLEVKNLLSNGSRMMMNLGVAEQEVSIHKILAKLDPKSQEPKVIEKEPTHVRARESFMARLELTQSMVVEDHKKFDKLGRFMLREEGRTVAIGLITKLYESTKEQVDNGTAPKRK